MLNSKDHVHVQPMLTCKQGYMYTWYGQQLQSRMQSSVAYSIVLLQDDLQCQMLQWSVSRLDTARVFLQSSCSSQVLVKASEVCRPL